MKSLFLTAALAGSLAMSASAQSVRNCGPRQKVVERLDSVYGEARQAVAMAGNNKVVEVFASLETGSWTIVVTGASGIACLVASGQAFELVSEKIEPPKESL